MQVFVSRYPVFGGINDKKWAWLCKTLGKPGRNWRCAKGAVWFKEDSDRTMYLLKWS